MPDSTHRPLRSDGCSGMETFLFDFTFYRNIHTCVVPFSSLLPASPAQASGKRCKKTSPRSPPTAKLNNTLSDLDSAAENVGEFSVNGFVYCNRIKRNDNNNESLVHPRDQQNKHQHNLYQRDCYNGFT